MESYWKKCLKVNKKIKTRMKDDIFTDASAVKYLKMLKHKDQVSDMYCVKFFCLSYMHAFARSIKKKIFAACQ